jgi:hypothetical protein
MGQCNVSISSIDGKESVIFYHLGLHFGQAQDVGYQSIKLSNGIWGRVEIKLTPGSPTITLSLIMEIAQAVFQVLQIYH